MFYGARLAAHVCMQEGGYNTPMDAAVSQGIGKVVKALMLKGVKCTTKHVRQENTICILFIDISTICVGYNSCLQLVTAIGIDNTALALRIIASDPDDLYKELQV